MKILVVNAGSSSLKYQLFDMTDKNVIAKGICERIGGNGGKIEYRKTGFDKITEEIDMPSHAEAMQAVIDHLIDPEIGCISSMDEINAVGHRVVQGGPYFSKSILIDDNVIEDLKKCIDIGPLHTIPTLHGIEGCTKVMPNAPQVLVFDTAFHSTMPAESYMYPIPYSMYEKYKIRRYGFHGTSHRFVTREMCKILGKTVGTKIITCHLGNGSSISAVKDGKVLDTSMGFTPLDGIEMGTRCGAIDPSIIPFIMEKENFTPAQMTEFMNKKCGLLGVSEISSDSRDIEKAISEGDEKAQLSMDILVHEIRKYIGGYATIMDGLDALVFTAGIGENNPRLREDICNGLSIFGIKINSELNAVSHHQNNIVKLSTDDSKVLVYLIPTNEELVIAEDTENAVKNNIRYERVTF